MTEFGDRYSGKARSLFEQIDSVYSPAALETRGENAWGVAHKFFSLIEKQIDDEEERKKLQNAWFRSVRDNDFTKFKRALRRHQKHLDGETE